MGYQTLARKILKEQYCVGKYTIYDTNGQRGEFCDLAVQIINEQVKQYMPSLWGKYEILDAYMPWSRTYEIGLKIRYIANV